MKLSLSKEELSSLLEGQCTQGCPDLMFQGVDFDSRRVAKDQLFIALKGEKLHGELFLPEVFARGAALALVESADLLSSSPFNDHLVVVKDSLQAFARLAALWRAYCEFKVIAITGSLGKTTCKEITRTILSLKGEGAYSEKSFNNHTGVPYTICNADSDSKWLVLEMGMNHPGELDKLSKMASPDIAAIVSVAPVHLGFFKDIDEIADAKCEILNGLKADGTVVLNSDNAALLSGFERWNKSGALSGRKVLRFGNGADVDLKIDNVRSEGFDGIRVGLSTKDQTLPESLELKIDLVGVHNAHNLAAAALCAKALFPEISLSSMRDPLEKMKAPAMRLNVLELSGGRIVINDCYNSNPTALSAALELLKDPLSQGKSVAAILGDMKELGEYSVSYHTAAGEEVAKLGLKYLVVVGEEAKILGESAKRSGAEVYFAASPEDAAEHVIGAGFDVLLIKGSRGIALERATKLISGI